MAELLTLRQRQLADRQLALLQQGSTWHGGLPVLLLDRCWLRLSCVAVEELARRLPPDGSAEAPELVHFRGLLAAGLPAWQAEQLCWQEYGTEACRDAQRRYWRAQEQGNQGWTLERYLELLRTYRRRFERERPRPLPLLVLARVTEGSGRGHHRLIWLLPEAGEPPRAMRHTCA
jgi:hypothetical protein